MSLQIIVKNSSVSDKEPTASQLAFGEIALNYNADGPFLTCKDTKGTVRRITGVWVNESAPTSPKPGELWLDIALNPPQLKVYQNDTNTWVSGGASVYAATTDDPGVVRLSSNAETQAGVEATCAVTPASLQSKVSDSTSTTSSTTIASSTAVKVAKDAADAAATTANAALPKSGGTITGNLEIGSTGALTFEGSTTNDFQTQLTVVDPTADRTVTLPDTSGVVVTTGDTGSVTSTMIADGTITDADISASAGIADTKLGTISAVDKVSLSALNIDGATDIGADLADADQIIVDDGGTGTNRKAAVTRITDYTFGKVSGDITTTSAGVASIKSSVNLSGNPTTTTQSQGTNNTTIATTAFVATAVSAAQQGLNYKDACRVATTANITLSGTQTIDGVAVSATDRVLVKNQTDATENGIYACSAGAWTRTTDFDDSSDVTNGAFVYISEGTANGGASYVLTTEGTITFGVTAITFSQFSGATQITAGNGLTKTGNVIDVVTANSGRIVVNADNIDLASGIATPGTYKSVSVDTYGRITGGTNPTSLSGYGITDAATSTHVHGNISNSGAIGSTANLPLITTTDGAITTGSFGTSANTFCQGNDIRLSDARTPTSHSHGNITNDGKIGTTSGVPIITGTDGVLQAGSFGSTAGSFCEGNDPRLGSTGSTPNSITFTNDGTGAASGSTFNGSTPVTISYNTIGALKADGTGATGTWNISVSGSSATCTGNSGTATKLYSARTISLGGDVSGSASFDGSQNITITATVVDDSHEHSIATIYDEHRLFNNMGDNLATRTDFNASYEYGWRFVAGTTNSPGTNGATQYYSLYAGIGNEYTAANYGMQIAYPRNVTTPYLSIRYRENSVWGSWQKISAGYADSAGAVAWTNISSKPTSIAGYGITDAPTLSGDNALTGANTFTNSTGQIFRRASTQDGILLRGRAGGTSSYNVEIVPTTLSASRTLTAPNVDGTIVTTGDTSSVTNTMLAGSIANNKLTNSSITINSSSTALGGTVTLYAGTTTLQTSSGNQGLTGISSIALPGATSGTITLTPASTAGTTAITIPATSGTLVTTGDSGSVTSTMIANGTIMDADINASANIADTKLANISTAGKVSGSALTGTIPSTVLANSTAYIGTTAVALNRASANQALTGISSIALPGATSGTITVTPAATAGTTAITIPATTGTLITTGDSGTVTSTMIVDGTIVNGDINASAAIAGSKISPDFGAQNVSTTGDLRAMSGGLVQAFESDGVRNNRITIGADSNGAYITSTFATGGTTAIRFIGATTERGRFDSIGRFLVGATTARANFANSTATAYLQLEGVDNNESAASITRNSNNAGSPNLYFNKSRGTALNSNTIVQADDACGTIFFSGSDGSEFVPCASISGVADSTSGANSVPGRIVFSTATNASPSVLTERLRITSDGTIRLLNSPGIDFSQIQTNNAGMTSETLDSYEEGTFTPTIVGTGTAGTGTYSVQIGRYTKIGQRVYFQINLTWSAHTGTTNMIIGALPFASANVANAISAVSVRHSNLTSPASTVVQGFVASNATTVTLESVAVAGGAAAALAIDTAATLTVSGDYEAA